MTFEKRDDKYVLTMDSLDELSIIAWGIQNRIESHSDDLQGEGNEDFSLVERAEIMAKLDPLWSIYHEIRSAIYYDEGEI